MLSEQMEMNEKSQFSGNMKYCFLALTWLLYARTNSKCDYLHNIKAGKIPALISRFQRLIPN